METKYNRNESRTKHDSTIVSFRLKDCHRKLRIRLNTNTPKNKPTTKTARGRRVNPRDAMYRKRIAKKVSTLIDVKNKTELNPSSFALKYTIREGTVSPISPLSTRDRPNSNPDL
jgi:hypothetical protein